MLFHCIQSLIYFLNRKKTVSRYQNVKLFCSISLNLKIGSFQQIYVQLHKTLQRYLSVFHVCLIRINNWDREKYHKIFPGIFPFDNSFFLWQVTALHMSRNSSLIFSDNLFLLINNVDLSTIVLFAVQLYYTLKFLQILN